jgi:hypothetical protein
MGKAVDLGSYIKNKMYHVQGYLKLLDAEVIAALGGQQVTQGISGGLAEIGVHHGKLFFILALLRQSNEKLLAMDLFEDDDGNAGTAHAGRDRAFFVNTTRLGVRIDQSEVMKCDSLQLSPEAILEKVGPVRLFSIDGGHLYRHVENDLALASKVLHGQGVVIVDDFCTARWPDVTFATYDFLRREASALVPFLLTKNKLYICRRDMASNYISWMRSDRSLASYPLEMVDVVGNNTIFVRHPTKKLLFDELRARLH